MKIHLPHNIVAILHQELSSAGSVEIGGILMGEHLQENEFKVCELTVQRHGGSFASFKRMVEYLLEPLKKFFKKTNQNYTKFNYLGEWHSHPSFLPQPSSQDHDSMLELITDPHFGGNFTVLIIVKLNEQKKVIGSVTVYPKHAESYQGELLIETVNTFDGKSR